MANADPLNSVDVLGLKPDLSFLDDQPGTHIGEEDYEELRGYAVAQNGLAYFNKLHELTGHALYKDFVDSYSLSFTPAAIFILREVFLRNGMSDIKHVMCLTDKTPVYQIPPMDLFFELVFQTAGIQKGVASFVVEGGMGILHLGNGIINFALDSTFGAYFDLFRYAFPNTQYPAWYPSYADAVTTVEDVLGIGAMIAQNPGLIWDGIKQPYVEAWAEGRYAEGVTRGVLDVGSMFVGVGVALKVARATALLKVLKRADADPANAGDFDKGLEKLIDELGDDPNVLRKAAEDAGLSNEVIAKINSYVPGRVQSRINLANGQTRFTPLRDSGEPVSAGFDHVVSGHFNRPLANNRSVFSITPNELKSVLQSDTVVNSPATSMGGGQYSRIVDVGRPIGNATLNQGGGVTSRIRVITDRAGNIITTYPVK